MVAGKRQEVGSGSRLPLPLPLHFHTLLPRFSTNSLLSHHPSHIIVSHLCLVMIEHPISCHIMQDMATLPYLYKDHPFTGSYSNINQSIHHACRITSHHIVILSQPAMSQHTRRSLRWNIPSQATYSILMIRYQLLPRRLPATYFLLCIH